MIVARCILAAGPLALGFALVSCVPEGDEQEPRGAISIDLTPSPAARGEPFMTSDGWTVQIIILNMHASASVRHVNPASGTFGDTVSAPMSSFAITVPQSLVVTGIEAGTGEATLGLGSEPGLDLLARASKGDRVETIMLGIPAAGMFTFPVEVQPDALTHVRLVVAAEQLFGGFSHYTAVCGASSDEPSATEETFTGGAVFDDFAAADADGDGFVSANEVGVQRSPVCGCCSAKSSWPADHARSMAQVVFERANRLFVIAPE